MTTAESVALYRAERDRYVVRHRLVIEAERPKYLAATSNDGKPSGGKPPLTALAKADIRRLHAANVPKSVIATKHGVTPQYIGQLLQRPEKVT